MIYTQHLFNKKIKNPLDKKKNSKEKKGVKPSVGVIEDYLF
jgi:hypothetical protein